MYWRWKIFRYNLEIFQEAINRLNIEKLAFDYNKKNT